MKEHSSQCNSDALIVTHNDFDLSVDFETKTISGTVEVRDDVLALVRLSGSVWSLACRHVLVRVHLQSCTQLIARAYVVTRQLIMQATAKAIRDDTAELVLDTSEITVHGVTLKGNGEEVAHKFAPRHKERLSRIPNANTGKR